LLIVNSDVANRQSSTGHCRPTILIFGASARAAAQSAVRAGMRPTCADLFADVDLCAVADVLRIDRYPDDFSRIAESASPSAWMYTGGLENHPDIVDAVSARRILWGNPAAVLRRVRDPLQIWKLLRAAGLPVADVRRGEDRPPANGDWLLKPIAGAAGSGISVWRDDSAAADTLQRPHYFQQKMSGRPLSAVFLATQMAAQLVGVTRQFVGTKTLHAAPFAYCGSLGPIELPASLQNEILSIGRVLASGFQLRGLFGIDFICDGASARLTEVNPRYTASVEILEAAFVFPLLDWHRRACETFSRSADTANVERDFRVALRRAMSCSSGECVGKAVLFAPRDVVTPSLDAFFEREGGRLAVLSDVPQPGTHIRRGRPICTVFATGRTDAACMNSLVKRVRSVNRHLSTRSYS
jgi:predicted ATP-grasp superfamily ATP-dependent carboligase